MELSDIGKAFTTRDVAWTYFGAFQALMLIILIVYKYVIPQSVCMCEANQTFDEIMTEGLVKNLNMIKFRDYGLCEELCVGQGQTWTGVEMDKTEFLNRLRKVDKVIFNLDFNKTLKGDELYEHSP